MKLASFLRDGVAGYGLVNGDRLFPVSDTFRQRFPGLKQVIAAQALSELAVDCAKSTGEPISAFALQPPIPDPARVICVGINYPKRYPLDGKPVSPDTIILFAKLPGTLLGDDAQLEIPTGQAAETFDYEGEVAVIIGKSGRHIAREDALLHVAGYTVLNDGSVRAWQKHSVHAGKNFHGSGSCGPWMVTADEIDDVEAMTITTRLNGDVVQHAALREMFFSIPEIIAYVSHTMPLEPGDIIATGSPEGSGGSRSPQRFLRQGDHLEFEVSGVGCLRNRVGIEG